MPPSSVGRFNGRSLDYCREILCRWWTIAGRISQPVEQTVINARGDVRDAQIAEAPETGAWSWKGTPAMTSPSWASRSTDATSVFSATTPPRLGPVTTRFASTGGPLGSGRSNEPTAQESVIMNPELDGAVP